ncbi:MAG: TetR/AcrR family transcriptional regulator [Nocardiopsaceae bacterium]|nr:TetR/AcrR family transcriptional regulator [Nocardiopsaceae bacterium]
MLRAFLAQAAQKGMAAITTRDIAIAAGVNEVTVYRHFGDKTSLAREAVRRFHPAAAIDAYDPAVDSSTAATAMDGLLRALARLQSLLADRPELLQFGLTEAARYPDLLDQVKEIPAAAQRMLTRAFSQSASQLRPEVSIDAEVTGFLGMLLFLATWRSRDPAAITGQQATGLLAARLRPLLRAQSAGDPPGTAPPARERRPG